MKKTYKTITGAYNAATKAGAKAFGSDFYGHSARVEEILANAYKSANALTLAKWNLAKFEKTLCALECTKEGTYKWTAVGHFDSEGLLYPVAQTSAVVVEDKPKQTHDKVIEDKPQPKSKPRTRKPTPAKGNGIDFSKVDGKTKSERNKSAHKLILATGVKVGTDEYKTLWEQWTEVR